MAAADAMAAVTPDRINLINENDARRRFFALLKHVTHSRGADAYEHLNKIRATDRKERNIGFACDRPRQQRLAGPGRAHHQHALRNTASELLEFFGVTQKLNELLHFILGFLHPGDVAKCDLVLVPRKHARLRFAKIECAFSGHPDLLAKKEVKYEQEERDRQESNHRLRQHV